MFCTKCGKQIPDVSRFCTFCGAPTGVNGVAPQSAEPVAQPATPVAEPIAQPVQAPQPAQEPVFEAAPQPAQEPVFEAAPQPAQEPVFEAAPQPAQEPVFEAAPQPAQEPVFEAAPQPVQDPVFEAAPQPAQEPVFEQIPQPAMQSAPVDTYAGQNNFAPNGYQAPAEPQFTQPQQPYGMEFAGGALPPYGAYEAAAPKGKPNIIGIIITAAIAILSVLAFLNPLGGLFGFALDALSGEYGVLAPVMGQVFGAYFGAELNVSVGFVNLIANLVAAIVGLVSMIIIITYIIGELNGKNRTKRARVAVVMCLIVTLLQVASIWVTNISIKDAFCDASGLDLEEIAEMEDEEFENIEDENFAEAFLEGFDQDVDVSEDEVYDAMGTDFSDIENADDAVRELNKMLNRLYIPGMYQYIIIVVSIAGIILIKKKEY